MGIHEECGVFGVIGPRPIPADSKNGGKNAAVLKY